MTNDEIGRNNEITMRDDLHSLPTDSERPENEVLGCQDVTDCIRLREETPCKRVVRLEKRTALFGESIFSPFVIGISFVIRHSPFVIF
jgi:hypothetical protein